MFTGDTRELLSYRDVWKENNNKKGFALHRGEYTSVLVEPATQFVTARGSVLRRWPQPVSKVSA